MNRLVQWFVENPIAANLLMVLILLGGWFSAGKLNKEVFPTVTSKFVEVSMAYPGAGPREVEELINMRIEEVIADIDGIEEITSEARQGSGRVTVEVMEGYDPDQVLNEIKSRVDAINTFPGDAERPVSRRFIGRSPLMSLALYGDVDEAALKETGRRLRNELSLLPGISKVDLNGARLYEMGIEVSEVTLRRHNLSFEQVAQAIRQSSLNLPAGTIKTDDGDVQVQTRSQAYAAEDFGSIVVLSKPDGSRLHLRDIAEINDGFEESDVLARFNGKPAVFLELSVSERPNVLEATEVVKDYIAQTNDTLPPGIQLDVWRDWSKLFNSRLTLLLENAFGGLLLVFTVLMLFLRPLLAMWVCVGIAIAFIGALWLLPQFGVSINMISLFAFLLVLGIVVDDAIIIGESIYSRQQEGMQGMLSATAGAKAVSTPVFFAVASSIIFFAPMLAVPGRMGTISYPIPVVVMLCLAFSLIESLLILPSHLSHMKPERESRFPALRKLSAWRHRFSDGMETFATTCYLPLLKRALGRSGATIAGFVVAFVLSLAVFIGGWLKVSFMPQVPSDFVDARVVLPEGTPFSETLRVLDKVEGAARAMRNDPQLLKANDGSGEFIDNIQTWAYGTTARVVLALKDAEQRDVSSPLVSRRWRELIGDLPEAEEYRIDFTINARDEAIRLNLSIASNNLQDQKRAAEAVTSALVQYPGVYDIKDSLQAERTEVELKLKPYAETLGVTLADIARQVRQGFYGEEVQRIPRASEDVRVMVRYSQAERRRLDQLDEMRIRTAEGVEIPLIEVAEVELVPGYTTINRRDRKRNITVTAEMPQGADAAGVVADLMQRNLQEWQRQFPGFGLEVGGEMQDQADFMDSVRKNFVLTVLVIYGLMAVAFRSYWQPVLILTAIPFGFMGAVIGHLVMGREVSMLSMLGFIACAGVVVNDNLVLLDRINTLRRHGRRALDAIIQAGRDRFRPIVLTSITTFVGLMPIMAEQSVQARFLIPMVISLGFGVLFATGVTLLLVPSLYLLGDRIYRRWRYHKRRLEKKATAVTETL